ncbi:acyl-CoA dehydrogenase C-terminal domain-containing protein [Psychrobacter aquaticus]|uniref:3-methylmercaptopropionyl-CoA dehydrogenase n=1 Tax=Psychrobacter aquaticus CMS 56 TaxID=1354303 RepID=U4T1D2_9GAMM|nr:acyl-CoA dehydrogenase C-terminal domain-containing protein [Psychrobacter aquaticus]ERL54517.1 Acyl-CoA dehydrogenase [Psychrobacter aquaticus CMS 56]
MQYKAPLRDIKFVMHELLNSTAHYQTMNDYAHVEADIVDSYLETAASFAENELSPLNQSGDAEGCHFSNGEVTTPKGFKEAYKQYCELGFTSLTAEEEFGGQNMPMSLNSAISEIIGTANWSFGMYPGLSEGCMATLEHHGTDEQKQKYLPNLIAGEWTGVMCLTEPQCGSDLNLVRTKAEPNDDGTYNIKGSKIWISAGEHDMSDNIIHIVLARLPNAPAGTKGLSLFVVPKFMVNDDHSLGARNAVSCGSIEHKMGIKASATCVMNYDGATGFLIGEENRGLNAMFTFMNVARIGTAIQGVTAAQFAFQGGLAFAKDRLAFRSLDGTKAPEKPADPIIVHPAVRDMLLTTKAFAEGGRALIGYMSQFADTVAKGEGEAQEYANQMLSLLTPIGKAFLTETGLEAAGHGVQILGGSGFCTEYGLEQNVRDTTISCIYEGTTQIQSLDLIGRKVLGSQGKLLVNFTNVIQQFCDDNKDNEAMEQFITPLLNHIKQWGELTTEIGKQAAENPEAVGGAAVDYMYFSGYVTQAYLWARMALIAQTEIAKGNSEHAFYDAKLKTAQFYFTKLLPRTTTYAQRISTGVEPYMSMDVEQFAF